MATTAFSIAGPSTHTDSTAAQTTATLFDLLRFLLILALPVERVLLQHSQKIFSWTALLDAALTALILLILAVRSAKAPGVGGGVGAFQYLHWLSLQGTVQVVVFVISLAMFRKKIRLFDVATGTPRHTTPLLWEQGHHDTAQCGHQQLWTQRWIFVL